MADLISRAAAINVFMGKPPECYYTSYIVDELNSLPTVDAEPVRQWISVKDRLPETMTDVLLKFTSNMAVGYIGCDGWWVASGGNWYTRVMEGVDEMPQFWTPLPEPPKEDE